MKEWIEGGEEVMKEHRMAGRINEAEQRVEKHRVRVKEGG